MAKLTILETGFADSIQDSGRKGYAHWGIPQSGAMDMLSMRQANQLVGNKLNQPILEICLKGGTYLFHQKTLIAICGAKAAIQLNGNKLALHYSSKIVQAGDILQIGSFQAGNFAYLAIGGSWQMDEILGSYSSYKLAELGYLNGRNLRKGDQIFWCKQAEIMKEQQVPEHFQLKWDVSQQIIRLIKGPEFNLLTDEMGEGLEQEKIKLSNQINRMGFMAYADEIGAVNYNIKSSMVLPGIVQLNSAGKLVILMRDAQTTGGYLRIGKVIEADMGRLAQMPPGSNFKFRFVDMDKALSLQKRILESIG